MSIKADYNELKGINHEISVLSKRAKELRKKKVELEERIAEYLKINQLPGIKNQNEAIMLKQAKKFEGKSNKAKDADTLSVLQKYGIENPEAVMEELKMCKRGDETIVEKIKIEKIKKRKST
jgi:hypothetical protein